MSAQRLRPALLALALLVALIAVPSAGAATLGGQWHLDQSNFTANSPHGVNLYLTPDSSGNGNDLASSDQIPRVAGKFGLASAITTQQEVPQGQSGHTTIQPAQLTLLAWVKRNGNPGNNKSIAGLGTNTGCGHPAYALSTNSGIRFSIWDGAAVRSTPSDNAIWDGQWHLVAGTFSGSAVRLFVDGAQVGNPVSAPNLIQYNQGFSDLFVIGDYPDLSCASRTFPGNIDEVRVYNGALSAAQISALFPPPPATVNSPGAPGAPASSGCPGGTSTGVTCQKSGGVTTITGTGGDDTMVGTSGRDVIKGGAGNDKLECRTAKDRCAGGPGNDVVKCNAAQSRCAGDSGKDKLGCAKEQSVKCTGGAGSDKVNCAKDKESACAGGSGKDSMNCSKEQSSKCSGGSGKDTMKCSKEQSSKCSGGSGNDKLDCRKATTSACTADSGKDKVNCAQAKSAKCSGGSGSDKMVCKGAEKGTVCKGGSGDDKLDCRTGAARCVGGKGDDLVDKRKP